MEVNEFLSQLCVFDLEGNSLDPDRIHCISSNKGGVKSGTTSIPDMIKFFSQETVLVGHNIQRFDIPVIERLLGVKSNAFLVDTLALSWYLYPDRRLHGLESWGVDLGFPKPPIEDWEGLSIEEYQERCDGDVEINTRLWDKMWKHLLRIYGTPELALGLVKYLSFKIDCARRQEKFGWKLDVEKCVQGIEDLEKEEGSRLLVLGGLMPKVEIKAKRKRPKKMYLESKIGVLSKLGASFIESLDSLGLPHDTPSFEYTKGFKDANPGSVPQIKDWLFSLGWRPDEFKYSRDKKTGDIRRIPQINKTGPGESGVTDSVKILYKKEPGLELLDGLFVIRHRKGILKGFLKDVDEDGLVRARIQGLTNTLRFKHKVVLNLPGVGKPYGELVRGCLICPEGYELCGSDMSSIEDRTKQHYMYPYDPEYVEEMCTPDFDPHINLAEFAGAMTSEEASLYRGGDKDTKAKFKQVRGVYKQGNYACIYLCGKATLSRSTGLSEAKAGRLIEAYWGKNWSVRKVAESCEVKKVGGQSWLYNPVSKLWYSLRADKDRFSTLNQGTAGYCFDTWLEFVMQGGPPIIGQMHDEWVALLALGNRDRMRAHVANAMHKTNKKLGLNRELDCDTQFGGSYADIH